MKVTILDTTLRDGAQAAGISFSIQDKLNIVKILDDLGINFIEAGNPASNPKEAEVFARLKGLALKNSKIVAFGSTHRKDTLPQNDEGLKALLEAECEWVSIFGKVDYNDVTQVLKTTPEENLGMIHNSIAYLVKHGRRVIFDAEHFFCAYKNNKEYAIKTLQAAKEAGASYICLCDTNGGALPLEVYNTVLDVKRLINAPLGIHSHDDSGMAAACTIMAAEAGAEHIQGTLLGYGERCGNANLSVVLPNLVLKKGINCVSQDKLQNLYKLSREVAEISNMTIPSTMPYIGRAAFAHKGGMHVDALLKENTSYEHINPELVGNKRRYLLSEFSGRAAVLSRINQVDPGLSKNDPVTNNIISKIKQMEYEGYQFEGADASFELLIARELDRTKPYFSLQHFKVIDEQRHNDGSTSASAIVKILVGDKTELTVAEGTGPVEALDIALRKALEVFYPAIRHIRLVDYKVRVLDSKLAAASKVRVLIESTDGQHVWGTVGVSVDIIEASVIALLDAMEYKLWLDNKSN